MDGQGIELYNLNKFGVVTDVKDYLLPPEAWTGGLNVRFTAEGVEPCLGYAQIFGTPSVVPEFIFNAPGLGASYWIYGSLTKLYVYDAGTHTNITRQTASVDVNYTTVRGKTWQGTIFGGIPIINNGVDIPQYWTALNPSNKMADMSNWPTTLRAKVVVAFGSYLVALNLLEDTTVLESAIRWSHKADPGTLPSSWDYTDPEVDAGRLMLTDAKGGAILDAVLLGNLLIIYKELSTHTLRFVGGQDILSPDLLFANSGLLAPKCACLYSKGTRHFVVTGNDIITHAGTKDSIEFIAEDKVRNEIFNNIDGDNYANSYVQENERLSEVIFAYPTSGSTYPNRAAVWNYKYNVWSFREWEGECADTGAVSVTDEVIWDNASATTWDDFNEVWSEQARFELIVSSRANTKFFQHNSGYSFNGRVTTASFERLGLSIDSKDREGKPKGSIQSMKQLSRVWPRFTGTPTLTVGVAGYDDENEALSYVYNTYVEGDDYIDPVVVGRLLAIRYEVPVGQAWKFSSHILEISKIAGL